MGAEQATETARAEHTGDSVAVSAGTATLERFDPRDGAGRLIDSEHRGRYWWAGQAVYGKQVLDAGCGLGYGAETLVAAGAASVVGVDLDEATVEEARARAAKAAASFLSADICHLTMPDDSFDVVVCFETIQHVADGERALGELHRVLRPDGLLVISSPSPDVFLPGNEHHRHEYRPAELSAVVEERFANVAAYRQHPWLASTIEHVDGNGSAAARRLDTRATASLEAGQETYSLLVASDEELPDLDDLVVLGRDFEVKWWAEQVGEAERRYGEEVAGAEAAARLEIEAVERRSDERVEAAETAREQALAEERELRRELAQAVAREAAAAERERQAGVALLDANRELAQVPLLQHRLEEMTERVEILENSRSWRLTSSLRALARVFRPRARRN